MQPFRPEPEAPDPPRALLEALWDFARGTRRLDMPDARGFSLLQTSVLFRLLRRGETRLTALAECLGADLSVASRQVSELAERGLVVRRRDPADGRAWLLAITPAGEAETIAIRERREAWLRRTLAPWSDEQVAIAADMVRALIEARGARAGSGTNETIEERGDLR